MWMAIRRTRRPARNLNAPANLVRGADVDGHPTSTTSLRRIIVSINQRIMASQWFRSVNGALNTIAGYEAMHILRKGQIRLVAKHDVVGQIRFIDRTFGIAA